MKKTKFVLELFRVKKWEITTDIKNVLDVVEDFIQTSFFPKNASSDNQGRKHLADEQSRQQSRTKSLKIIETKPSQQSLGTQNYVFQKNKLCLDEQQVKIMETKRSQPALGTLNSHVWKDVSQENELGLQEHVWKDFSQKNKLGLEEHIWKDISHKLGLEEQQVQIRETKGSQLALGTQNYNTWKDISQQSKIGLKEQQGKIIETKPSPQALGTQNYNTWKDVSQQKKICLNEQQLEKQYSNSPQHVNQVSIMKGTSINSLSVVHFYAIFFMLSLPEVTSKYILQIFKLRP